MTSIRQINFDDLFKFNALVFDPLTEVYGLGFFLRHIIQWPELTRIAFAPNGQSMGYIFGKCTGPNMERLHGHICALTVSAEYRRLGLASALMALFALELDLKRAWYVDLFVRQSNVNAYKLYSSLGYIQRRLLLDYYPGTTPENAYNMRKALARDVEGGTVAHISTQPEYLSEQEEQEYH
ncbi:N-alpha-acetyltransferase 20 [Scaptodrosophila lebanonensis]|uniref:N-alpha-acetyltransferase 20 n=1 Tax=Drosophila lebanonensis TaxID=7225 RepID=A0A6J2TL26_DROLE|nr:N-alpha-acetyltransferase 20 [Scaptodrosophila lebanonensis]